MIHFQIILKVTLDIKLIYKLYNTLNSKQSKCNSNFLRVNPIPHITVFCVNVLTLYYILESSSSVQIGVNMSL